MAGLPNRVYFQAQTTLNKPAELQGRVVDQDGKETAVAMTLHDDGEPGVNQGMGRFEFTPRPGKKYELKIDSPIGVEGTYLLPKIHRDGVVMSIPQGVANDTIRVVLHTTRWRNLLVGAYCRGRLVHHEFVAAKPGQPNVVELKTGGGPGGVYRVTVFEEQNDAARPFKPVAERLLYRRPDRLLHVDVTPDKKSYSPGDRVTLTVKAKDEAGGKAPAVVLLSAVDQSFVKLGDEKTARTMPTHFYLTTEVKQPEDLEHADFLVSRNPKAEAALDLLLGTQGWRRFLEQTPDNVAEMQKKAENNRTSWPWPRRPKSAPALANRPSKTWTRSTLSSGSRPRSSSARRRTGRRWWTPSRPRSTAPPGRGGSRGRPGGLPPDGAEPGHRADRGVAAGGGPGSPARRAAPAPGGTGGGDAPVPGRHLLAGRAAGGHAGARAAVPGQPGGERRTKHDPRPQ